MSAAAEAEGLRPLGPEPEFAVTGAAHMAFAATPTMLFAATAADSSGYRDPVDRAHRPGDDRPRAPRL